MRLAFLTNVFPSPIAPTKGTFNLELAKALTRAHALTAIVPVAWTDECRAWWRKGQRMPWSRENVSGGVHAVFPTYWYPPGLARAQYDKFLEWSLYRTLQRLERQFRPNAVLSYWAHPDGAVAVNWARRMGIPGWIMVGGSDVLLLAKDRRRGESIRRALLDADGVIAVSHDLAQELTRQGVPQEKVHVVHRGVNAEQFYPADKAAARRTLGRDGTGPLLLWVGRMVEVKGLDLLLSAAAKAKAGGADFQLVLIGDGPLRSSLENQVQQSDLNQNVLFVGSLPHRDLATWYQAADWTVLTSHSEGVPNVLLESHACGTPFVATAVGGVPEIAIDGFDQLVPPGDVSAFAAALRSATQRAPDSYTRSAPAVPTIESSAQRVIELLQNNVRNAVCEPACP